MDLAEVRGGVAKAPALPGVAFAAAVLKVLFSLSFPAVAFAAAAGVLAVLLTDTTEFCLVIEVELGLGFAAEYLLVAPPIKECYEYQSLLL